ncbi:MAG: hypothetical protein RMI01_08840 [Thermodesulfovibrio sp.]|nr:hypothetical protein [Thermodesulfovibrio sp.]
MVYIIKDWGKKRETERVLDEMMENYSNQRKGYEELKRKADEMKRMEEEIKKELERKGYGLKRVEARSEADLDKREVLGSVDILKKIGKLYAVGEDGKLKGY